MGVIKRIFGSWWFLSLLCVVIFIVFFALLLPLLIPDLRPWPVRLVWIVLAISVWLAVAAIRVMRARRASRKIAESLQAERSSGESDVLAEKMRAALAALRADRRAGGDYLYSRPWYVIIGPPGVGKTTALANSGLHFYSEAGASASLGGTRNIQFLFAEEAVLIDTAGRYTSQDSDTARDRRAWQDFLSLLRRTRPLQPINGVIVALAVDELSRADADALDGHAEIVRQRLRELQSGLQIHIPVYVMFTKADLIVGFAEFFDDLDVEGRRAVLGMTLPLTENRAPATQAWAGNFDALADAVEARMSKRLQAEHDTRRRGLIVGFPSQIAALRGRLLRFLEQLFPEDDPTGGIWPRGMYLTSGTQEGTPFDQVISQLARLYDAPQARGRHGRAYFINRLLKEVMIGEAGLVRRASPLERRDRRILVVGAAAIAAVCLVLIGLWSNSYIQNRRFQAASQTKAMQAQQLLRQSGIDLSNVDDTTLKPALPILAALRDLPGGYAERHNGGHSVFMTFGLYQKTLSDKADLAYRNALQRIVLPRLLLRMEDQLQSTNVEAVYVALKSYLMLGQQHPLDRNEVFDWVTDDWKTGEFREPQDEQARAELAEHLKVLLAEPDLASIWADGRVPLDSARIQQARTKIEAAPLAERAYAILKQRVSGPDWTVESVLDRGDGRAFADGEALLHSRVPYLYTASGYRAYLRELYKVQAALEQDARWIYGDKSSTQIMSGQMDNLARNVSVLYVRDYTQAWQSIVAAMEPADYLSNPDVAKLAASATSPIRRLLQAVDRNTHLSHPELSQAVSDTRLGRLASRIRQYAPGLNVASASGADAGSTIDAAFEELHAYVAGGGLSTFLQKLHDLALALETKKEAGGLDNGQVPAAMAALKDAAAGAPPGLQSFQTQVTHQAEGERHRIESSSLEGKYAGIRNRCAQAVEGGYPFQRSASIDAQLGTLNEVFGNGGELESFIKAPDGLAPLLDTSSPSWHWQPGAEAGQFSDFTAGELQKADELHDVLVNGVQAKVTVAEWGGAVNAADLSAGGAVLHFEQGQPGPADSVLRWNTGQNGAQLDLSSGTAPAVTKKSVAAAGGPFALFRVFDHAKLSNATSSAFDATFGSDTDFVKFHVSLLSGPNAFGHRVWQFKCPASL